MNTYRIETKDGTTKEIKKSEILRLESFAYYSGFNGLEIKGIEYGIDDHVLCVSGARNGKPKPHRLKIYYTSENAYIKLHGYRIQLNECIRTGV